MKVAVLVEIGIGEVGVGVYGTVFVGEGGRVVGDSKSIAVSC